jgi:RimJ/RimL family protein N-acetyltransferase
MKFDNYIIRQVCLEDADNYFFLIDKNRKRLEDFFAGTVSKTRTPDDTKLFVTEIIKEAEAKTYLPFVIVDVSNKKLIGYIDIKSIDWSIPKAEIGCFIDEDYSGKGISGKVLSKITEYCFDVLKINKLFLRTHRDNISSRRIAEKNGFEVEGIIRRDYKTTKGDLVDLIYYGKLRNKD